MYKMTICEECFGEKEQVLVAQLQDLYMLFFFLSHGDLLKQVTIFKDEYF